MKKTELETTTLLLNKVKATLISTGMPYSNVRHIDDAISIVARLTEKQEKKK